MKLQSHSVADTHMIAAQIADVLQPRDVILASGEMGAGKTTFTKGLGTALGIDGITSPTFVLMCSYDGRLPLHHVDLYRLDQLQEIMDLGLFELIDEGGVGLIEWGEAAAPIVPADYLSLTFHYGKDESDRVIEISTTGNTWNDREAHLRRAFAQYEVTS